MRLALAAAMFMTLLALVACGGNGPVQTTSTAPAEARRLSGDERRVVTQSGRTIERYCTDLALSLGSGGKPPTAEEQARAFAAADRLIALAREKPAARAPRGGEMQLLVSDLAENLEGSNCDPRLVQRIDEGLATVPTP